MRSYFRYVSRKIIWYVLTFLIAVFLNFFLPRLIPGNPISAIISQMATGGVNSEALERLYESFMKEFGLDKPLVVQFFNYIFNVLKGDLGTSFSLFPKKVGEILAEALPWTISLQLPAILTGWIIGNIFGVIAAYKRGKFDSILFPIALFVNSIPYYCLAIILLYIFGVWLGWFPIGGGYSRNLIPSLSWNFIKDLLHHYFLPFISIVLVSIGGRGIGMREMAIYELNTDYVLYSRLLGISDKKILKYVFRNAMLPQITGLALSLGTMVGGALITEIVFSYPGIGTWLFNGIRQLDYPLIQGATLIITMTVLAANFTIDLIYGWVDPRIKAAQLEEM